MSQIVFDAVAPMGIDQQVFGAADGAGLGDKEGAALRQVRVATTHEVLVLIPILEDVDLDDGIGAAQLQFLVKLIAQAGQFAEKRQIVVDLEIRKKQILGN